MNLRYRNQAILGLSFWFAAFIAFMVLFLANMPRTWERGFIREGGPAGWLWVTVLAQYVFFIWGGRRLTRAKGYPATVLLLGLVPCFQILTVALLLVMPDKHPQSSRRAGAGGLRPSHESQAARVIRFRRNALLGNALGLAVSGIGISLVLVPLGLSADPDNQVVIGIAVFLAGYAGVISGCWWWAKAKHWPDALVLIGLLPIGILLVPWVRLIFVAAPALLPVSMVMMPLILLVIMLVLPDKSGIQRRKSWERD